MIGAGGVVWLDTAATVARSNELGTGRLALWSASAATQVVAVRGAFCAAMRRVSGPRWRPMRRMDGLSARTGTELVFTMANIDVPGVVLRPIRPNTGALTRTAASLFNRVKWRTWRRFATVMLICSWRMRWLARCSSPACSQADAMSAS